MGVYSSGNSYKVAEDLIYSFPVQIKVRLELVRPVHALLVKRRLKVFPLSSGQNLEDRGRPGHQRILQIPDGRHRSRAD